MTRHYTYGAPTAETSIFMAGARVHSAYLQTLCGRAVEDADYPPDYPTGAPPPGVCRQCWARARKDHHNNRKP